jgi:hypothetical protein
MSVVLIPDFSSELIEGLARDVAIITFQAIDPDYKLVTLVLR